MPVARLAAAQRSGVPENHSPTTCPIDAPICGVILMGLRGSGKSTIAPLLAARLGTRMIELDERTPALLGHTTAAAALRAMGQPAFREAEARALAAALAEPPCVIALGGGTPTAPGAAALLAALGGRYRLVYLHAPPRALRARLTLSGVADRPPLIDTASPDALSEIEAVYAARDPLYRTLAHTVVEVDGRTAEQCAADIEHLARS